MGGDSDRDLQLQEEYRRLRERVSGGIDVLLFETQPGAGHDDRRVLAVGAGENRADPGGLLRVDCEVGRVDSRACQCGAELIAEVIAADAADEEGAGVVEGRLCRLIAGLAAGREGHAMAHDTLALAGKPVGRGDHVHMDAADYTYARWRVSAHPSQR